MNNFYTTEGRDVLIIGSDEVFTGRIALNELPNKVVQVTLNLYDPSLALTSIPATIDATGFAASAPWTVAGAVGSWSRAWQVKFDNGRTQIARAIGFSVQASPA